MVAVWCDVVHKSQACGLSTVRYEASREIRKLLTALIVTLGFALPQPSVSARPRLFGQLPKEDTHDQASRGLFLAFSDRCHWHNCLHPSATDARLRYVQLLARTALAVVIFALLIGSIATVVVHLQLAHAG